MMVKIRKKNPLIFLFVETYTLFWHTLRRTFAPDKYNKR